jgi:hypothetical protein
MSLNMASHGMPAALKSGRIATRLLQYYVPVGTDIEERPMNRIVVTGGSGKAGRAVVNDLNERGYQTLNVDLTIPPASWGWALAADLTDLGQTHEALQGADAVVHLAAVPAPEMRPEQETFRTNVLSTYNVFSAAADLNLKKVVWASSETVLGLPFETELPDYAPIDEQQTPYPESSYALSKLLCPSPDCGSPTSWNPTSMPSSPPFGTTRRSASGTCGDMSTVAMSPRLFAWHWNSTFPARSSTSSRPPTQS